MKKRSLLNGISQQAAMPAGLRQGISRQTWNHALNRAISTNVETVIARRRRPISAREPKKRKFLKQLASPRGGGSQPSTINFPRMNFSSLFGFQNTSRSRQLPVAPVTQPAQVPITPDSSLSTPVASGPTGTHRDLTGPIGTEIDFPGGTWFLPTQVAWLSDPWHLRIWEKSRQVGATKTDALDSVLKASPADARFDVWVTSRDDIQARLYLEDCIEWAKILHLGATYLGVLVLDNFGVSACDFLRGAS